MNNKVTISLEEYKELLLKNNKLNETQKIVLERIKDYIKENATYQKDGWGTVNGLKLNVDGEELLKIFKYVDKTEFLGIYKYVTDKDYKEKQEKQKMELLREIKETKKELED